MRDLQFSASIEIQAREGKQPRVEILAYAGGIIRVANYGPVVIDLAGLQAAEQISLLQDHNESSDGLVGYGTATIEPTQITIAGQLFDANSMIVARHKAGYRWQASVGVSPESIRPVRAGETVFVNGRNQEGPFTLVEKGLLRETSILPLGADSTTSVSIAAKKVQTMAQSEIPTAELANDNDELKAEQERIEKIETICAKHPEIAVKAVQENWTINATQLATLRASYGSGPRVHASHSSPHVNGDVLAAAVLIRAGSQDVAESHYDERTLQASRPFQQLSLLDLCREINRHNGDRSTSYSRTEMIRAAMNPTIRASSGFSTISLPTLLNDSANKSLLFEYRQAPASWRSFAAVRSVDNFLPHRSVRMFTDGVLEKLGATGEIKHTEPGEQSFGMQVATFARMMSVSRQTIINDSLDAFSAVPRQFARLAARSLNNLVWSTMTANVDFDGGTFFSVANDNLLTGAGSELSFDSISDAIVKLRGRVDDNGENLDIQPSVLVVSPEYEMTARQLLQSVENQRDQSVDQQGTMNPIHTVLSNLQVEPRISNTTSFPLSAAENWYLFSQPSDAGVVVAFLDNMAAPTIETEDTDFNTLGIQTRCFWDYGVSLSDHRTCIKADGS